MEGARATGSSCHACYAAWGRAPRAAGQRRQALSGPASTTWPPSSLQAEVKACQSSTPAAILAVTRALIVAIMPISAAASSTPAGPDLGQQVTEGLRLLREDLTRAVSSVHSGTFAEKVASLSHELEMIHSTLATLKDIAGHQRDHLRTAQELLAVRAKQGTIEIEVTQEMLTNEREFLERFQKVLSNAAPSDVSVPSKSTAVVPASAPTPPLVPARSTAKPPPIP